VVKSRRKPNRQEPSFAIVDLLLSDGRVQQLDAGR
jgi:hypothetical protein